MGLTAVIDGMSTITRLRTEYKNVGSGFITSAIRTAT